MENLRFDEKLELVSGHNSMETNEIKRLGIKKIQMADGPHGLRKQLGDSLTGINKSELATSFPTAATIASSWNKKAVSLMGEAIAKEAKYYGVNLLLAPGVNIKKNPLCGRNFEYYSEDPLLAGTLGTSFVKGVQKEGIGACVKHFALNNSENFRYMGNSVADDRAIREIYLKPFELIVKNAKPKALMCAYNQINGEFCSENKWLLKDVLREEWRFSGLTMTDWGATHDRVKGLLSGMDLEMPGDTLINKKLLNENKEAILEALDYSSNNVIKLANELNSEKSEIDFSLHHKLAYDLAVDSAVLLKNDGILPLKKNDKYLIVGELFEKMRYQGAGSSLINPQTLNTPLNAFDEDGIVYRYVKGYKESDEEINESLIREAVNISEIYEKVIVFAGLTDNVETEGSDRVSYSLPKNQVALINALLKFHNKVIVVLFGGAPFEISFADDVRAILNMYLPGENGGKAVLDILFGHVCPSGKLAETWPLKYTDVPFYNEYGNTVNELYKESIYVGYRYYDTFNIPVRYPFGYGLSYTHFKYSDLNISNDDSKVYISFNLTNTGKFKGKEIVEVFVKNNYNSKIFKANKELKSFDKISLNVNETKQVNLSFNLVDLAYYDILDKSFVLENGEYEIQICSSLNDIRLKDKLIVTNGVEPREVYSSRIIKAYKDFTIDNNVFLELLNKEVKDNPPLLPLTLESRLVDFKQTFMGRRIYNAITSIPKKKLKEANKIKDSKERESEIKGALFMLKAMENNSLRSMSMTSSKLPYNVASGLVLIANGHIFKGLLRILKKIK